jgi:hypothetical protein
MLNDCIFLRASRPSINKRSTHVSMIPYSGPEDVTGGARHEPPDETTVTDWLASSKLLPAPYADFAVIDLTELIPADEEHFLYMGSCISMAVPRWSGFFASARGPSAAPERGERRRYSTGDALTYCIGGGGEGI